MKKFKQTGYVNWFYKNKLDKACFAHDGTCADSEDLTNQTVSDNVLEDRF